MSDEKKHDDGGPMFPHLISECQESEGELYPGITLHDHCVIEILKGLVSNEERYRDIRLAIACGEMSQEEATLKNLNKANMMADAMIAEKRSREGGE